MSATIATVFLLALLFFISWWRQNQKFKNSSFLKKIPQVESSLPILGIAMVLRDKKAILGTLMKYTRTYGGLIKGKIGPIRQVVLVTDYNFLECIFNSAALSNKSEDYRFFEPWLGTGLLTSNGLKWKMHRRLLTPAFHFQILRQFVETFESCGNILVEKFGEHLREESFDVQHDVTLCALDLICESILGITMNMQSGGNLDYVQSVHEMCRIVYERGVSPLQMNDFLYPLTKNFYTQRAALKVLHRQSNKVIETRRKQLEQKQNEDSGTQEQCCKNKKVFLDLLLETKIDGRPLSHEEIRNEVDTFLLEGHETVSTTMSFALYCLANNAEVQERAAQEQRNIFENKTEATVTYPDLQNMKYLELVIKETLRLYPPVPYFMRKTTKGAKFGDDVLPDGITLFVFVYGIHRNPKYFPEPEKFIPERFETSDGKYPYAYIPFSAGPRNCIGQKFAMLEMKSVLSKVLRNYKMLPAQPQSELQVFFEITLKSSNGIKIRLEPRN